MKKYLTLLITILLLLNFQSLITKDKKKKEIKNAKVCKITSDFDYMTFFQTHEASISLAINYKKTDGMIYCNYKEIGKYFDEFVNNTLDSSESRQILYENRENISEILKSCFYSFLFREKANEFTFPVGICGYKEKFLLAISDAICDNTYNSYKLTNKQIAAKILEKEILPFISLQSYKLLKFNNCIKYFGFSINYGVKNFTDEDARYEFQKLFFITSIENIQKYENKEITQESFISNADIFLEIGKGGYKKIELKID